MLEALRDFWAIIMAFVGLGVWLVKLEAKMGGNSKDIARLEKQIERERLDTREKLEDLTDMMREQNRDIKILLGRGHIQHWDDRTQPPGRAR
ncbi:hypothetical protein JJJ17_13905 [Paracoccus caeni]|uniref:Uncharacterized protein n=1 Tax=Paracoccus caeni TaxID=657651 RepID=A0A934SDR7_9RHOB|nr:hypothetical protein [Paracoccus caeni]MBK4217026.1 hypothetical protein [Paracoccus caeni]